MSRIHHSLLPAALLALIWAWDTSAQVPVEDAQGAGRTPASQQAGPEPNNSVLVDLYLQLQALQTEVQNLRGLVEEQGYQIRRMEEEQRDRYLDLDRRLSGLGTGGNTGIGASPGGIAPPDGTDVPAQGTNSATQFPPVTPSARNDLGAGGNLGIPPTVSAPGSPAAIPASEQELYRTALDQLLEESNYEQSISLFQQYIDTYPMGDYITNAYYWQGEALILVSRYDQAKDVFLKIIDDYPNDPKAPGAMLKLGVVYSRMGDNQLATQVWQNIRTQYPESLTEIRAAEDYLRRAGN